MQQTLCFTFALLHPPPRLPLDYQSIVNAADPLTCFLRKEVRVRVVYEYRVRTCATLPQQPAGQEKDAPRGFVKYYLQE